MLTGAGDRRSLCGAPRASACPRRFLRGRRTGARAAASRDGARVPRQRRLRRRRAPLALQRAPHGTRPLRRRPLAGAPGSLLRAATRLGRRRSIRGRRQLHTRAARLRKADRDRLLGRARTVFSFPHMFDFLADELPRLGRGRLPGAFVRAGPSNGLLFWHLLLLPSVARGQGLGAAALTPNP